MSTIDLILAPTAGLWTPPEGPRSALTLERPDIWSRALALATRTTGMVYLPKLPGPDGEIWACGGNRRDDYRTPTDPYRHLPIADRLRKLREELERERGSRSTDHATGFWIRWIKEAENEALPDPAIEDDEPSKTLQAATVFVPDGAMEWLLHEVGHWVAATPEERLLPNYGLGPDETGWMGEREWQAWGFEEIIMAPFGPSRMFAPPSQRTGAAFKTSGPMPSWATHHAALKLSDVHIDIEEFRALYGEWVRWDYRSIPDRVS